MIKFFVWGPIEEHSSLTLTDDGHGTLSSYFHVQEATVQNKVKYIYSPWCNEYTLLLFISGSDPPS